MGKLRAEHLVPLLAAVLGLAGGLLGAYLGARATVTTQREQASEDRRGEAREKRAKVYSDFLARTEPFAGRSRDVTDFLRRRYPKSGSAQAACRRRARCGIPRRIFREFDAARSNFQGAINQVYIYGSPRGLGAARKVAAALPPAVFDPGSFAVNDVDEPVYSRGYNAVLDTMCAEVSVEPRLNC